jgi:hypothetical protein
MLLNVPRSKAEASNITLPALAPLQDFTAHTFLLPQSIPGTARRGKGAVDSGQLQEGVGDLTGASLWRRFNTDNSSSEPFAACAHNTPQQRKSAV